MSSIPEMEANNEAIMKKCRNCKKEKKSIEFYLAHGHSEKLRPECIKCGNKSRKLDNWKSQKCGGPYDGDIDDAEYLRDRRNIFNNNGNGWWWFTSGYVYGNKRRH